MKIYAVIDTNVIVSALLSHYDDAATVRIIRKIIIGDIVPVFNEFYFFRCPPSPLQHPKRHHLILTADTPTRKQAKSRRCLMTVVRHHRYSTLKGIA